MGVENSHNNDVGKGGTVWHKFFHSQLLMCPSLKYPFHLDGKEIRVTIVEFWQELARLKIHKDLTTDQQLTLKVLSSEMDQAESRLIR
jgi:hypothetical protein